jgi:hypothetical protein
MAKATERSKTGFVTISIVRSHEDARRITTKLESAGIECSLMDERGSMIGALGRLRFGGVKVQVERSNVTRAVQLLKDKANGDISQSQGRASVRRASRVQLRLNSWQRASIEIIVLVAVAALLAALMF